MAKLKSVGVREFRNNASTYLSGSEPIAVNRHGKVIGFYIPIERDEDEVRRAVAKLETTIGQILEETGMAEEDLASLFDLRQRLPE
jgi:antitoxin (DNA-binding transcriptional repressor) of toxin-antitoxin stability system